MAGFTLFFRNDFLICLFLFYDSKVHPCFIYKVFGPLFTFEIDPTKLLLFVHVTVRLSVTVFSIKAFISPLGKRAQYSRTMIYKNP